MASLASRSRQFAIVSTALAAGAGPKNSDSKCWPWTGVDVVAVFVLAAGNGGGRRLNSGSLMLSTRQGEAE